MTLTAPAALLAPQWWLDAEAALMAADSSFLHRPPQAEAARLVDDAMRHRRHAAIEARTGTGKTAVVLLAAEQMSGRVVISTATRALQEQLRVKDVPHLQEVGLLTRSVVVLEGRNRYACLARTEKAAKNSSPAGKAILKKVLAHLKEHPGKARREDIPIGIPDWLWVRIHSDSDACGAMSCSISGRCAYTLERELARTADVIVLNHATLLADALLKGGSAVSWGRRPPSAEEKLNPTVVGPYGRLIIDEAHALEAAVEGFGEHRVSIRGIQSLATRVSRTKFSGAAVSHLGDCVAELQAAMIGYPLGSLIAPTGSETPVLGEAMEAAKSAGASLRAQSDGDFEGGGEMEVLVSACYALGRKIEAIDKAIRLGHDDFGPRAPSMDERGLTSQLVDAAPWLTDHVWDCVPTVAMSATLAIPSNKNWVTKRIGLPADVEVLGDTFDLETQRLVYVTPRVEDKAAASQARCTDADVKEIRDLVDASRGRALILFPANIDLKFVAERLETSHTVLAQGVTKDPNAKKGADTVFMSNADLAKQFREDTSSVLLATRSFFEGVDFPGEACSLVVIARFPNLRPDDPLVLARRLRIEASGGNAWRDLQEPSMALLFRQAVGRAIRRADDKGVVAVLDPRTRSKGYAVNLLRSLRPSPYTDSVEEVREFLA